jgi:hypothetical protein
MRQSPISNALLRQIVASPFLQSLVSHQDKVRSLTSHVSTRLAGKIPKASSYRYGTIAAVAANKQPANPARTMAKRYKKNKKKSSRATRRWQQQKQQQQQQSHPAAAGTDTSGGGSIFALDFALTT